MKRAFVLTDDGHLASALVPKDTQDILHIGQRIRASRPLQIGYGALIEPGEQGTIDHIDPSTGFVEVLMDKVHRGLREWDNHIWLQPFHTEDILGGIVCCGLLLSFAGCCLAL